MILKAKINFTKVYTSKNMKISQSIVWNDDDFNNDDSIVLH